MLVLLLASDFFSAWDGQVVSARPRRDEDAATMTVLVVSEGGALERNWPTPLVERLELPIDPLAVAPLPIPPERPRTRKARFSLHSLVQVGDGDAGWEVLPTTSPRGLALAGIVWLMLIALRNMAVSGTPWTIEPHEAYLPPDQGKSGQVVSSTRSVSHKAPPPPKPKRGRGRR